MIFSFLLASWVLHSMPHLFWLLPSYHLICVFPVDLVGWLYFDCFVAGSDVLQQATNKYCLLDNAHLVTSDLPTLTVSANNSWSHDLASKSHSETVNLNITGKFQKESGELKKSVII